MLVEVCSADTGTKASNVLAEIARLCPEVRTERDCLAGLNLRDVPGRSFSLKYQNERGILVLPIGRNLPDSRIRHVAESIVAMIRRGENWTDKHDHVHTVAWGESKQPRKKSKHLPVEQYRRRRTYKAEALY